MGRPQRFGGRPATSFKFQPTKVSKLAEAKRCAVMNPSINPESFKRSYGFELSAILAMLEDDRAARERLL